QLSQSGTVPERESVAGNGRASLHETADEADGPAPRIERGDRLPRQRGQQFYDRPEPDHRRRLDRMVNAGAQSCMRFRLATTVRGGNEPGNEGRKRILSP